MLNEKELQKKLGDATEKFTTKTLRNFGYWVYNMPMKTSGQPFDIIAVKGGKSFLVWLVDAKHVRDEQVSFTFARIEPNQISSMAYAHNFAKIENLGFAIFFDRDKQLRWLPYLDYVEMEKQGQKSVNMNNLKLFTEVLSDADRNQ